MNPAVVFRPLLCITMRSRTLPVYFIYKVLVAENGVHHVFQIVACSGITVKVDRAGSFHYPSQLQEPSGHHHEIGRNCISTQREDHVVYGSGNSFRDFLILQKRIESLHGCEVPFPEIRERGNLGCGLCSRFLPEQYVVIGLGIKRGIQIY